MRSALFFPALLVALACASPPRPTPADIDAAITRADFSDWLAGYHLATKNETLTKTTRKGITIVEYHWLGDDGELAIGIDSRIYWTTTEAEADAAYRKMLAGGRSKHPAIAWFPVHSGGKWAEAKKVYRIVRADRQTVGHVLFARRNNVAVMVSLTGMHSENPKLFERKLEPELEKLSQHDPRLAPPAPVNP
jgi:hypothetical protein